MSTATPPRRRATLRALIIGGTATLVLSTCIVLVGLLVVATRMRASLDERARTLFAEQQTAASIGREVERQLLDAAAYLNDRRPEVLARFRARGEQVYTLERRYLFRDLALRERLQVERVKELHQTLEVLAQSAFDARARGDRGIAAARADTLFAASRPVQQALDEFLAMREERYLQAHRDQAALLRRLYVGAAIAGAFLLGALLLAVRFAHRRILVPVDELARAADRVGGGDLAVRVVERGDDELTRLARSFNAMTAGLDRLQRELRGSEERYRGLVELTPDAIVLHDDTGIRLANPEAVRLFGAMSEDVLVGMRLADLLHADGSPTAIGRLDAALAAGAAGARPAPAELAFDRLNGGTVHGELVAAPFEYDGHLASLVAIRDVTARRQAESALRDAENRLRQAQKMEAVGRLAGGIAHDFNNLLTVILSHCDLLLADLTAGDQRRADVEEVRAAGARAAALTRQLLAFSRSQVLQLGAVDLNDVVRQMTTWLRRLIASDIELRVELAPALDPVRADRGQIEQVILNLALNARDAMPAGGRLTIRTARVDPPPSPAGARDDAPIGTFAALTMIDSGVGMDERTKARVFEPFFTTKEVGRGTGLGLATVFGIVHQSGGHVRVESEPGRGSRFEVLLPTHGDLDGAQSTIEDAVPATRHGNETVLLAEDDHAIRAVARRVLIGHGYTVLEAPDGAEAERIAAAYDGRIDLLLTDVVMPGFGGRELARRLTAARPGLRVLLTSGYTDDEIHLRGVGQTQPLLEKPYSPRALAARVRDALDEGT